MRECKYTYYDETYSRKDDNSRDKTNVFVHAGNDGDIYKLIKENSTSSERDGSKNLKYYL